MRTRKGVRGIKALFLGNLSDPKYEGLMSILDSLRANLRIGKIYVNDVSKVGEVDLTNIHSSGFYEGLRFQGLVGKKIYSLHANIIPLYFVRMLDYLQWLVLVRSRKGDYLQQQHGIAKILSSIISNFTPIFVKRFILNKMDVVIVPNNWLLNKLKLKNGYLIRHGIGVRKFRNTRGKKKKRKIVVSYFGHPDTEKGIFEVIKSFSQLQDGFFDKRMFFTESNESLENYIKKKDVSIKVFGFVKNIVNEYNNSDIVVLPYRHALGGISTPLVLLEAMSCEKAVITTSLPHLKEICGNSVVYVKPYSPDAITDAVKHLAKTKGLMETLGKRARKRIVEYYNQEKMFAEYRKLYERVIASSQLQTNAF